MAACRPEVGNGGADRGVLLGGELVDVTGVCDLALCSRIDAVDLARSKVLEVREAEFVRERVDLGMLQKLVTCHIDIRHRWILLERSLAGNLLGEIVTGVEELEEATDGVEILAGQLDLAGLFM